MAREPRKRTLLTFIELIAGRGQRWAGLPDRDEEVEHSKN